ncbi:MAG TPA: rhomboid family intramembrane serine protease [Terracidiphilus sp.]
MPRIGATPFSFPDFRGATRRLVLANLIAYFLLAVAGMAAPDATSSALAHLLFYPATFLHGWIWQPLTYSLVHPTSLVVSTLFELMSVWFLAGFLEAYHNDAWVMGLYASSVIGSALAALAIYGATSAMSTMPANYPLYGCFGGIFGLLIAIGVLYGDVEFQMFFVIGIKARYMAIVYALVAIAMLFGSMRWYAFAQIGGALAGLAFIRMAPKRGFSFLFSEQWYGMRNNFYRWKRRRTAKRFEVYMKSQGRTVRFDGNGRQIDEDSEDKKRWN